MKLSQSEGIDSKLNEWKKTLLLIQSVLADADKKQITESAVRMWVNDLQDLAYDMEDVLDEIATKALRRKLNHESHASTSTCKLFKFVPTCCKHSVDNWNGWDWQNYTCQILYNDNKVKDHFELKSWVCVSDEFSVFNICKAIFQKINGTNQDFADLNLLQEALKEKLQKIRFLFVLDDVWNEDESKWELLKGPLLGAPGSKIIVTTQNTKVASVMDSDEVYHLDVLSDEDALSLFSQHALGEKSFEKYTALKLYGEGMVKKCGSLPLALKTLGRVMKGNRNSDEWEKLLKSEIWDIQDGKGILLALRLSYYHLPTHLKQPFWYCSSYLKDYVSDKK
ncbi:hypothetical protein LXL04_033708 [Taraxacum kok-saghyz]